MNKFFVALTFASCLVGCADPTEIGSDLLAPTLLPVSFTDTVAIELGTVSADTTLVTGLSSTQGVVPFGCLDDPLFGTSAARVGFELIPRDSILAEVATVTFDSAVLIIPLSDANQVGDTLAEVAISVIGAEEGTIDLLEPSTATPLEDNGRIYASTRRPLPRRQSTVTVYPRAQTSEVTVDTIGPVLRIPLNAEFLTDINAALLAAEAQMDDSATDSELAFLQDSAFKANFPGLILADDDCTATMGTLTLSASRTARLGVSFYYQAFGRTQEYAVALRRSSTTSETTIRPAYAKTFGNTLAGRALAGTTNGDSVAVLQGLEGLGIRVEIPDVSSITDKVVNLALLELPIVSQDFTEAYRTVRIARQNSVGNFINAGGANPEVDGIPSLAEGGSVVRALAKNGVDTIDAYRLNVTALVQRVADGDFEPEFFVLPAGDFLNAQGNLTIPGRTVVAGTNRQDPSPARLLLATTELP